jgi:hypothetical protein
MKILPHHAARLFMFAIACGCALGPTAQAGAPGPGNSRSVSREVVRENARLIVRRAADFGTTVYLQLYLDGVYVTTLALNEGYEGIVRPGTHDLAIATGPSAHGKSNLAYHHHINMKRGETYALTALWIEADRASLETANPRNLAGRTRW